MPISAWLELKKVLMLSGIFCRTEYAEYPRWDSRLPLRFPKGVAAGVSSQNRNEFTEPFDTLVV
jgi:hypothetical protein